MKVALQWALSVPAGWVDIDVSGTASKTWSSLPKKAKPTTSSALSLTTGWITAINVQGVLFEGFDCYAVEGMSNGGVKVSCWNPDVGAAPRLPSVRSAEVWEFHPPKADARFGGETNTWQVRTVYSEGSLTQYAGLETTGGPVVAKAWSTFTAPAAGVTRFGVYVPDALYETHKTVRSLRSWKEWVA